MLTVGNCDIHVYVNILVFYEMEWNKILLEPKLFYFWVPDFNKLLDENFPTFNLFHSMDKS